MAWKYELIEPSARRPNEFLDRRCYERSPSGMWYDHFALEGLSVGTIKQRNSSFTRATLTYVRGLPPARRVLQVTSHEFPMSTPDLAFYQDGLTFIPARTAMLRCIHCDLALANHAGFKCLYDSTEFRSYNEPWFFSLLENAFVFPEWYHSEVGRLRGKTATWRELT